MSRIRWYTKPLPLFVAAVLVTGLGLAVVNPFMANDRFFGRDPWHTVAFFVPAFVTIFFLHYAVPHEERASVLQYCLRVFGTCALAYAVAVVLMVVTVVAVTGELI